MNFRLVENIGSGNRSNYDSRITIQSSPNEQLYFGNKSQSAFERMDSSSTVVNQLPAHCNKETNPGLAFSHKHLHHPMQYNNSFVIETQTQNFQKHLAAKKNKEIIHDNDYRS